MNLIYLVPLLIFAVGYIKNWIIRISMLGFVIVLFFALAVNNYVFPFLVFFVEG